MNLVEEFENITAKYAGAKYGVATNTGASAIGLCCSHLSVGKVVIPKKTTVKICYAIMDAGGSVAFEDREWSGCYQLKPYPIYDCALRFKKDMYIPGTYFCISFAQPRGSIYIGRGGMILCDDVEDVQWFKKARVEKRVEFYPDKAARGLKILATMREMPDVQNLYPDLSMLKL
jgi:hypothetical protein